MFNIIGKKIKAITQLKRKDSDDDGFLLLEFNDKTNCLIVGEYGGYTDNSKDEYPTTIHILFLDENNNYISKNYYRSININDLTPI